MSEQTNQLEELRSQILNELKPLLVSSDILPEQKFTLLLNAAMNSGDNADFINAKAAALAIEDTTSRANALLDLLGAVDMQLGDIDENTAEATPEDEPETGNDNQGSQG